MPKSNPNDTYPHRTLGGIAGKQSAIRMQVDRRYVRSRDPLDGFVHGVTPDRLPVDPDCLRGLVFPPNQALSLDCKVLAQSAPHHNTDNLTRVSELVCRSACVTGKPRPC